MRTPLALALVVACTPAPPPSPPEPARAPPQASIDPPAPVAPPPAEPTAEPAPTCDATPRSADPDDDPDPDDPDTKTRRERATRKLPPALAAKLKAALPTHHPACDVALRGPCAAHGDLDGDGQRDDVVLVRDAHGDGGLAILWARGGVDLLGAGRRCQYWQRTELPNQGGSPIAPTLPEEEIDADLDWMRNWAVWPRELRDGAPVFVDAARKRRFAAIGALGDGILLDGGDAAVVAHRTTDGWTQLHLGF